MARTNHQFAKRQRELAKKQKKEEKLRRKLERKSEPTEADESVTSGADDNEDSS